VLQCGKHPFVSFYLVSTIVPQLSTRFSVITAGQLRSLPWHLIDDRAKATFRDFETTFHLQR
jgi:hypothetical protein